MPTPPPATYPLSLHDALPILDRGGSLIRAVRRIRGRSTASAGTRVHAVAPTMAALPKTLASGILEDGGILRTGVRVTRSEEHTSELQSRGHLVCRLLLEKKKK